jgi:uncharacterized protein YndB with AHSA1/START domain
MNLSPLSIKAQMQVSKSKAEVYEAIINPELMKHYFIGTSSGRMESGNTIFWTFPEFTDSIAVHVVETKKDELVSFYWENSGNNLLVEIQLSDSINNSTLITITEKSMPLDEIGLQWLSGNSFGWSNFLSCLKAYLEYGINLRKGAFDFMATSK